MINLKKGQKLYDNQGMVVYDSTGYYNDGDSVLCASAGMPDEPLCRYEAKFIAYGAMVYSISDPDELMEQIIKLDPNSLFGKETKQVAADKAVEEIVPQKSEDLNELTEAPVVPPDADTGVATTTPAVVNQQNNQISTTTPPVVLPETSTPTITPSTTSTTTPQFDLSTTTPPFDMGTSTPTGATSTTTPSIIDTIFVPETLGVPVVDTTIIEPPADVSTTTPSIIETIFEPATPDAPADAATTTSEVVAFAKKMIKKQVIKKLKS
jgi:hypothetical protein